MKIKNLFLPLLPISLCFIGCNRVKCSDPEAINYNDDNECLYCFKVDSTEIRVIEIIDNNEHSIMQGLHVADVIFHREFKSEYGGGCNNYTNNTIATISTRVVNKCNRKANLNFQLEFFLKENYISKNFGVLVNPNDTTTKLLLSNEIYSSIKDATIKVSLMGSPYITYY